MPIPRLQSIRSRLLAILLLAIGAVMAVSVAAWRFTVAPALQQAAAQNQLEIARRAAEQIDDFLERRVAELQALEQIGRLWEAGDDRLKEALYRLLKIAPSIQEVSVSDRTGREILRVSRTRSFVHRGERDLVRDEAFVRAIRGETYLGPVAHDRTAEPFITVAVPIKFTAMDIRGALVAVVSLKTLWDEIAHISFGKAGRAFVVDAHGTLIAHPNYSKVLLGPNLARLPKVRDFLASPSHDTRLGAMDMGESGRRVLSTFATVSRPRWGVIVEEPVETALQGLHQVERLGFLLALLTLVGTIAVSWVFSERIARPVRQLKEGAVRIARGDLEHTLAIRTGDEIEDLAAQFNQMAGQVLASQRDLERKVAEKTRDLSALYAVTGPISRISDLGGVLDDAAAKILEVTGAEAASVRVLGEESDRFTAWTYRGFSNAYVESVSAAPRQNPAAEEVIRTGHPIIAEDLRQDARFAQGPLIAEGFRSAAYLPLVGSGDVMGLMTLASRTRAGIHPGQAELLGAIAHQISIAIENARLLQQEQERRRQVDAVRAVSEEITRELDLGIVLELINRRATELLRAPAGAVWLWEEAEQALAPRAWQGFGKWLGEERLRLGEGVVGTVALRREGLIINDLQASPHALPAILERTAVTGVVAEPLLYRERLIGAIIVDREAGEGPFTEQDRQLLALFAAQAAIAIENARLFHLEQDRRTQVEAVRVVTEEITRELNLAPLLQLIAHRAAELSKTTSSVIYVWDEETQVLVPRAWHGFTEWIGDLRLRLGEGLAGAAAQRRERVQVGDYRTSTHAHPLVLKHTDMTAAVAEPLLHHGRLVGVIVITNQGTERSFREEDYTILSLFAGQAAVAIENARLYAETKRKAARLETLARLSQSISSSLDRQRVFDDVVKATVQLLEVSYCCLYLVDEANEMLHGQAEYWGGEADTTRVQQASLKVATSLAGWALEHRQSVAVPSVLEDPRWQNAEWASAMGFHSCVAVPLLVDGLPVGTLTALTRTPRHFGPEDIELLETFAAQAAAAIENARLYTEIHRHSQDLERKVEERTRDVEAANRAKSDFLAHMSHELRTPLNAIIGFADMLKMSAFGPLTPKQTRYVDNIQTGGRHLLAIVNDVLDLAKVEAGRLELLLERVPLERVVEEALGHVRTLAEEKAIALACEVEPDLPDLQADPLRLRQILVNLLSNAIKFTPERGHVIVRAAGTGTPAGASPSPPPWVELTVRDSGVGLALEDLGRLFRKFEQIHRDRRGKGTGLGLALTRHLVELHGGTIRAHSDGPGQGSTFTVRLPGLPARQSPHVLLATNDREVAERIAESIRQWEWTVTIAPTLDAARAALPQTTPDLVILDPELEGGTGPDLVWEVRNKRGSSAPILLLAEDGSPTRQAALAAGADDWLEPAASPQVIRERAGKFLQRLGWPPLMLGLPSGETLGDLECPTAGWAV